MSLPDLWTSKASFSLCASFSVLRELRFSVLNRGTPITAAASNAKPMFIDGSPFSIFCTVLLEMLARVASSCSDMRFFFLASLISCPSKRVASTVVLVYERLVGIVFRL